MEKSGFAPTVWLTPYRVTPYRGPFVVLPAPLYRNKHKLTKNKPDWQPDRDPALNSSSDVAKGLINLAETAKQKRCAAFARGIGFSSLHFMRSKETAKREDIEDSEYCRISGPLHFGPLFWKKYRGPDRSFSGWKVRPGKRIWKYFLQRLENKRQRGHARNQIILPERKRGCWRRSSEGFATRYPASVLPAQWLSPIYSVPIFFYPLSRRTSMRRLSPPRYRWYILTGGDQSNKWIQLFCSSGIIKYSD